jgi:hypothetical protein
LDVFREKSKVAPYHESNRGGRQMAVEIDILSNNMRSRRDDSFLDSKWKSLLSDVQDVCSKEPFAELANAGAWRDWRSCVLHWRRRGGVRLLVRQSSAVQRTLPMLTGAGRRRTSETRLIDGWNGIHSY